MKKPSNVRKRILLFLFGGIGDVLLFTPALEALGKEFPEAYIDAVVRSNGSSRVLKYNPYINDIIAYNRNSANQTSEALRLFPEFCTQISTMNNSL